MSARMPGGSKARSAAVTATGLSFSWPDDTPVLDCLSFTLGPGRTGLVAPNGAGKSTLLRLIAGELSPTARSVVVDGVLGWLPQGLPSTTGTVADVLDVAPVLAALRAIESGDADARHVTVVGTDWDVEERSRAQLDRLGLGDVGLDRPLGTLSGGQVVTLGLAGQLLRDPDVLLLDEPTNDLDAAARERLVDVVTGFRGCLVVVSHDRTLLEHVDAVAELEPDGLRTYGGAFSAYETAVAVEQEAAERDVRTAEAALKREKRERQQARERAERRSGTAARNVADAGLPKILAGARQRRAQESAGRAVVHASGVVLRGLFGAGVDLVVRGPERIGLTGGNGVGKSTLLRLLASELMPERGTVHRAEGRVLYLSQRLDLLDPAATVAQCLAAAAPTRPEAERLTLLARFLFRGARTHLPVTALSGGERLRATLACVLFGEPAPPFQIAASGAHAQAPTYLDVRLTELTCFVVRRPQRSEIPVQCEEQLVVEHYSR